MSNANGIQHTQRAYTNTQWNTPKVFRDEAVTEAPVLIVDTQQKGVNIFGYNIINPNSDAVYIKLIDFADAIPPVLGVNVPFATLMVPGNGSVVLKGADVLYRSEHNCWVAVTTGYLNTDVTGPTTPVFVEIIYPNLLSLP